MKKITLIMAAALSSLSLQVMSQCTPQTLWATSALGTPSDPVTPYTDFMCATEDTLFTRAGWKYYDGDAYFVNLQAGSDVTVYIYDCTGYPASITIVDSTAGVGTGTFIPGAFSAANCPNSVSFIAPYTGKYWIVFDADNDCGTFGSDSIGNVAIKLHNAANYPSCNPLMPTNDLICGALPLTLNSAVVGDNSFAAGSDADDATLVSAGYACFTPNNTMWYSYTPATSDSVEVFFSTNVNTNPMPGWFGILSGASCSGTLNYEGCYYGPLNATASGSGATADPYDGVIPTIDSVINHIYLTGGTQYFIVIDGVSGSFGNYTFEIRSLATSITEKDGFHGEVSLYPNPSTGLIKIENKSNSKDLVFDLYNSLGQNVMSESLKNLTSTSMDLTEMPKGIYTVKLSANGTQMTQKVVLY